MRGSPGHKRDRISERPGWVRPTPWRKAGERPPPPTFRLWEGGPRPRQAEAGQFGEGLSFCCEKGRNFVRCFLLGSEAGTKLRPKVTGQYRVPREGRGQQPL
ncbi:unnamed protein product [Coccothraustes coccothraustes]